MPGFSEVSDRLRNQSGAKFGSGVTPDEISAVESALGLKIRGEYREFLLTFGWLSYPGLEVLGLGGPPQVELVRTTMQERGARELPLPNHLLPIFNDGTGDLACLDTAAEGEPPIVWWLHSDLLDAPRPDEGAPSFSDWLLDELQVQVSAEED